jgi:hypothetical protein
LKCEEKSEVHFGFLQSVLKVSFEEAVSFGKQHPKEISVANLCWSEVVLVV